MQSFFNPENLQSLQAAQIFLNDANSAGSISRCLFGIANDLHTMSSSTAATIAWLLTAAKLLTAVVKNFWEMAIALTTPDEVLIERTLEHFTNVDKQAYWYDWYGFFHSKEWAVTKANITIAYTTVGIFIPAASILCAIGTTMLDWVVTAICLPGEQRKLENLQAKLAKEFRAPKVNYTKLAELQNEIRLQKLKVQDKQVSIGLETVCALGLLMLAVPSLHLPGAVLLLMTGIAFSAYSIHRRQHDKPKRSWNPMHFFKKADNNTEMKPMRTKQRTAQLGSKADNCRWTAIQAPTKPSAMLTSSMLTI